MSRHLLIDRADVRVVLGFDRMLRSFFGQVFKPRGQGTACTGWPTSSGLGTRRPVSTYRQCSEDLNRHLQGWAFQQLVRHGVDQEDARDHLIRLVEVLRWEWDNGKDAAELPLPACLRGEA